MGPLLPTRLGERFSEAVTFEPGLVQGRIPVPDMVPGLQ